MNWSVWFEDLIMALFYGDKGTPVYEDHVVTPPVAPSLPVPATLPPTPKEVVCAAFKAALGKDMRLDHKTPTEVGCVTQLMGVLAKTPYAFHLPLTFTPYLFNVLKSHPQWKITLTPAAGCIILSPTINDAHEGHVGGFISDTRIASNNSYGPLAGKWTDNYSFQNWVSSFRGNGLHIYIFEPV